MSKTPYANHLREARLARGFSMEEAAQKVGVTKSAISSWELSKTQPDINSMILLSQFYSVSLEYLVGMTMKADIPFKPEKKKFLTMSTFILMHRHPAYSNTHGWFLVDTLHNEAVFAHKDRMPLEEIKDAVAFSTNNEKFKEMYTIHIIPFDEVKVKDEVWVEPICEEGSPLYQLKGRYKVKDGYVENSIGNRFFFDTYQATWYAFNVSEATDKTSVECYDLYNDAYDEGYEDGYSAGGKAERDLYREYEED